MAIRKHSGKVKAVTASEEKQSQKYVSADIVRHLRDREMTLKEIGAIIHCSESFVCLVAKGQRSLTLNHLAMLEKHFGIPIPQLLLESVDESSLSDEMRPLYHSLQSLLSRTSSADCIQFH